MVLGEQSVSARKQNFQNVCLVARLGKHILEKQTLKIIIDILWYSGINSDQCKTAWAILLFISGTRFCCLLVPLKVMPHHAWVSCLIIELTINAQSNHATSCLSLMPHHQVNNKCNRVKRAALKMATLCPT